MRAMADTNERRPLNPSDSDPDYDAIFANERRQAHFAQKTAIGVFRNPRRFSLIEWVFLVVSSVSMLGVLALNIERFVTFDKEFYNLTVHSNFSEEFHCPSWYCTSDFTFSLLLLLNLMFCFFYCYHGLFLERKYELLAFVGATVVIVIYVVGNYVFEVVKYHEISAIKKVRLVLLCVFGPVNITLAVLSWWKMGYFVFNVIGANKILSNAYQLRAFVTTLQYFHVELMANIVILSFALNGDFLSVAEKVVILLLFLYLLSVVVLGIMAVNWEKKVGVVVWYLMMAPFAVYYIYKLVEVSLHWADYTEKYELFLEDGSWVSTSIKFVGIALIFAVCLGLLILALLAASMIFVLRNFNLGLKEKVDPPLLWCVVAIQRNYLKQADRK